ncbi:MAG: hypothetical protein PHC43_00300 [Candidatus Marinimicrobia bacterium]|jgi:hypothetical protein|nr:hypothetical protein [Candidatus Neomarinimicrobiota bacterium]
MGKTLTPEEKKALDTKMEDAAEAAWTNFDLGKANETGDGVKAVANWIKANYLQAGYAKLCRRLLTIAD